MQNIDSNTPEPLELPLNHLAPIVLLIALSLMWALLPRPTVAHAELACATPHTDAVLVTAPEMVEIWFSEEGDAALTTLTVLAEYGSRIDQDDTTLDLNDLEREHVTVSLRPGLGPGTYTVRSRPWTHGAERPGAWAPFSIAATQPARAATAGRALVPVPTG